MKRYGFALQVFATASLLLVGCSNSLSSSSQDSDSSYYWTGAVQIDSLLMDISSNMLNNCLADLRGRMSNNQLKSSIDETLPQMRASITQLEQLGKPTDETDRQNMDELIHYYQDMIQTYNKLSQDLPNNDASLSKDDIHYIQTTKTEVNAIESEWWGD